MGILRDRVPVGRDRWPPGPGDHPGEHDGGHRQIPCASCSGAPGDSAGPARAASSSECLTGPDSVPRSWHCASHRDPMFRNRTTPRRCSSWVTNGNASPEARFGRGCSGRPASFPVLVPCPVPASPARCRAATDSTGPGESAHGPQAAGAPGDARSFRLGRRVRTAMRVNATISRSDIRRRMSTRGSRFSAGRGGCPRPAGPGLLAG